MFRWFIFISSIFIIFWWLELVFWDSIRWSKDQRFMQKTFNVVYNWTIHFWDNFHSWLKITKSKIEKVRGVAIETQQKIDTAKQSIDEAKKVINTVSEVKKVLDSTWSSLGDNINKVSKIMDTFSGSWSELNTNTWNIIKNQDNTNKSETWYIDYQESGNDYNQEIDYSDYDYSWNEFLD